MAYPPPAAQRPPPMRQYNNSPAPSGYAPSSMSGSADGYGPPDSGYADAGYDAPGYGYQTGPPAPIPPQAQPRSMRPPGSSRPPPGYDSRRGYPSDRGAPQKRSRPPGGSRPPREGDGFDGPFPAVPPGRDPRDPRDPRSGRDPRDPRDPRSRRGPPPPGLERDMAAMDISGRPPPRPHTSNSNGRRPDMRAPPMRGPPPGRGRGGYYPGPPRSGRPPMGPNGPMGPPRSATMPLREPPPGVGYGEMDYPAGPMGDMPQRPSTAGGMRPPPRGRPGNGMDAGLMLPPPEPANRVSYAPKDFLDSYYEGGHDDEPDMPNFDAMPHAGPVDEMGLETPKHQVQTPTSPASSGGGHYAAYTPGGGPGTPQSQNNLRSGTAPNQFEIAGFNFDIGGGDTSPAASGYGHSPGSYDQSGSYFPHNGAAPYSPASSIQPGPPGPPGPPVQQGFSYEQQQTPDAQQNPDALPSHPTPFRPGHDQGAKPAPVRNYNNAPPAAQAAPQAPLPATPDGRAPVTHEELERLQQKARGNPSDQATQLLLAKKLVEAATVLVAENSRLDPKTKAKAQEKYITDAHKIVKKLSQSGYADAQFYYADCYGEGLLGLEADPREAFNLYHSAAKAGHPQSAYRVAVCCEIGQEEGGGTKRDPFKAVTWYKKAAALGDTPAMYKMGMISLKGLLGQARSPREGVSWLKRAAERADEENPHALHELALMYSNAGANDSIVRDEAYASQLFHQAAELGYKFSQFRLGTAYEYGLMGCPVDNRMSIIWYTRAAAQGEHQSELALSGWYLTGSDGVLQQSDTEAYLWARKAATAGLAKAEYAMGYFTETGIGSNANLDDAKRWYWRAAAQGFPKARERLEELKKGGGRMQKTRLSRAAYNKQSDGDCILM